MTDPVDATAEFTGLNAYDRIYRCANETLAKVRVEDVSPNPSTIAFKITGSWADETGAARAFQAGHFIVEPIEIAIRPDSPTDIAQLVENARIKMANIVCAAAANQEALAALSGIKPKVPSPLTLPEPDLVAEPAT